MNEGWKHDGNQVVRCSAGERGRRTRFYETLCTGGKASFENGRARKEWLDVQQRPTDTQAHGNGASGEKKIEDAAGLMNDEALNDNAEKRIRNERGWAKERGS